MLDPVEVNTPIDVGVVFKDSSVLPRWFVWEGRKYTVREINYLWDDHECLEKIIKFSVSAEANSYELAYYTSRMIWKLNKVA